MPRLTFHFNGQQITLPMPEGSRMEVPDRTCPVCTDKVVLVAHNIKQTTISRAADVLKARRHLVALGADVVTDVPPGPWEIHGENPQDTDRTIQSDAVCSRCRSRVGHLILETGTFFGHHEDRMVRATGIWIY